MEVNEGTDLLKCRLCLDRSDEDEQMFDLFSEENETVQGAEVSKMFFEKVEICCGVRIRESTEMPSKICFKCFDMTRIWFNFRQMVLNSQVYLESMCTDRKIPNEIASDESKYINYLLEDLQINKNVQQNDIEELGNDLDVYDDDDENFDDADLSDDNFIQVKHEIDENDSDSEIEKLLHNITEISAEDLYEPAKVKAEHVNSSVKISRKPNQRTIIKKQFKRTRPESPNTYMCNICGNVYQKKTSFRNHMNIHSNIKPHQCEICNKAFRQVSELKNHMRRHTGEKPYKCEFCERRFIDRSEKHRHERVHTNSRPYECTVCGKSFAYSTILKNHSKLHSGEKDYHCVVCQKYFSLPHQLKAHLQTITHKQKEAQYVEAGYEVVYE